MRLLYTTISVLLTLLCRCLKAAVQNELNGSVDLVVTPPFNSGDPGYTSQVLARAKLFDDAISTDTNAEVVTCTGPTSLAGDVLSFHITATSGSLTARSFVFLVSHATMSATSWTSYDVSLLNHGSEVASYPGLSQNKVFYSRTPVIFDELHIKMKAPVNGFQLCFDEIMAIRAHYLNPSAVTINIAYISEVQGYTSVYPSYSTPFMLSPQPFSDSWDFSNCWTTDNIAEKYPLGWSRMSLQQRFSSSEVDNSQQRTQRLITGTLIQWSPNQVFHNEVLNSGGTSIYILSGVTWDDSTQEWAYAYSRCPKYQVTGNFFMSNLYDTHGPSFAHNYRVVLFSPIETISICSFQLFGYESCVFTITATSTVKITWPIGTTEQFTYSDQFLFTSEIYEAASLNSNTTMCQFGADIYQQCTQCQNNEVLPFQGVADFKQSTVRITSNSSLDTAFDNQVYTVRFYIYDVRDGTLDVSTSTYQEYQMTFLPGCSAQDLQAVKVGDQSGNVLGDFTISTRATEKVTTYSWINLPTCRGYTDQIKTSQILLVDSQGTELMATHGLQSYSSFTDCKNYKQTLCAYVDTSQQKIYLSFDSDSGHGTNTLYFLPQITALSGEQVGQTRTQTYTATDSFSPQVSVTYGLSNYCDVSLLGGAKVVNKATGQAPADISATTSDPTITLTLQLSNPPNCQSFLSHRTEFVLYLIDAQGSQYDFLTSGSCPISGACGRVSMHKGIATVEISINQDASLVGSNTVYIQTTVFGFDSSGSLIQTTYIQETSFSLAVTSVVCQITTVQAAKIDQETWLAYTIGQDDPVTLTLQVQRVPACATEGTVTVLSDGTTDLTSIQAAIGLSMTASQTSNEFIDIDLEVSTTDLNLAGLQKTVKVSYEVDGQSYTFSNIYIDYEAPECLVEKATFNPSSLKVVNYSVGAFVVESVYIMMQLENVCETQSAFQLRVGTAVGEEVTRKYGIAMINTANTVGDKILVTVTTATTDISLIGSTVLVEIKYTVGDEAFDFPKIKISFTEIEDTTNDATSLESLLTQPATIPCLNEAATWQYSTPQSLDPANTHFTWRCSEGFDILSWSDFQVTIKETPEAWPKDGKYSCEYTLIDKSKGPWEVSTEKEKYKVDFYVLCERGKEEDSGIQTGEAWDGEKWVPIHNTEQDDQGNPIIYPVPEIEKIDLYGRIYIRWNQNMLTEFNSTRVTSRQLSDLDGMKLTYIQNSDTELVDTEYLSYNLTYGWLDNKTYVLGLDFVRPEYVSADSRVPDYVKIEIPSLGSTFVSTLGFTVQKSFTLLKKIPKQYPKEGSVTIDKEKLETSTKVVFISSFVLSYFYQAILNQMLGVIANLQLILHMFLVTLEYPANVQQFFGGLFPLVTFDMVSVSLVLEWFGIDYSEKVEMGALTNQFDTVGYSTTFIILNLGSLFFVLILQPVMIVAAKIFLKIPCLSSKFKVKLRKFLEGALWNNTILFWDSAYLIFAMVALIGLKDLRLDRERYLPEEWVQSWFCIFMLVACFVFPVLIVYTHCVQIKSSSVKPDLTNEMTEDERSQTYGMTDINRIRKEVYTESQHEKFLAKYGTLIQDYRLEALGKSTTIALVTFQILRKFVFALSVIMLIDYPFFTIFSMYLNFLSSMIVYGWYWPYKEPFENKLYLANESVFFFGIYLLLGFTEVNNIETKQMIGNCTILFVSFESFGFVCVSGYRYLRSVYEKTRLRYLRKRNQRRFWKQCEVQRRKENQIKLHKTKLKKRKERAFQAAQGEVTEDNVDAQTRFQVWQRKSSTDPILLKNEIQPVKEPPADDFGSYQSRNLPHISQVQQSRNKGVLESIQSAGSSLENRLESSNEDGKIFLIKDELRNDPVVDKRATQLIHLSESKAQKYLRNTYITGQTI